MADSQRDTQLANEFARNLKGWGWPRGREEACLDAVRALGKAHPAFGDVPASKASGCIALAHMGMTDELVQLAHKTGAPADYDAVRAALVEVGDAAALKKLDRKKP